MDKYKYICLAMLVSVLIMFQTIWKCNRVKCLNFCTNTYNLYSLSLLLMCLLFVSSCEADLLFNNKVTMWYDTFLQISTREILYMKVFSRRRYFFWNWDWVSVNHCDMVFVPQQPSSQNFIAVPRFLHHRYSPGLFQESQHCKLSSKSNWKPILIPLKYCDGWTCLRSIVSCDDGGNLAKIPGLYISV